MKRSINTLKKIIIVLIVFMLTSCNDPVDTIKNGILDYDKSITIGQLLQNYKDCSKVEWSKEEKQGRDYVTARCFTYDKYKRDLQAALDYYQKINYKSSMNYWSKYAGQSDKLTNMFVDFIFLVNKDKTINFEDIAITGVFTDNKKITSHANNKDYFIKTIYEHGTLDGETENAITVYMNYVQNMVFSDNELAQSFHVAYKNDTPQKEMISPHPFGLVINKTTLEQAYSLIPCVSTESKFIDGVFPNNGYYISYSDCGLVKDMSGVDLGFDDDGLLKAVYITFSSTAAYNELLSKLNSYDLTVIDKKAPFLGDRWTTFFNKNKDTVIELSQPHLSFETTLNYKDRDFSLQLEKAKKMKKEKESY